MDNRGFRIASLDGIRGIAALIVFVAHAGLGHIVPGGFGVTIFFFLSGYLITTLLRRELDKTGSISLKHFYLRRVYRIFPPLYLVLGLALLIAAFSTREVGLAAVLGQMAHLTNYVHLFGNADDLAPYTHIMWSLSVEEHFYLIFPLALLAMSRRLDGGRIALALAGACLAVLAWRTFLVLGLSIDSEYIYMASDSRMDSILFGCILGLWRNPKFDESIGPLAGAVLFAGGIVLLLASFVIRDPVFRDTLRYSIQGIGLFPVFYCAVRFNHWFVFRWLDSALMRALGLISYTFYLCHWAMISMIGKLVSDPVATALAAFAASVTFSGASYLLMERRFGALRRTLHGVKAPQPIQLAPAVSS